MEAKRLENKGMLLILSEVEANYLQTLFGLSTTERLDSIVQPGLVSPLPPKNSRGAYIQFEGAKEDLVFNFYVTMKYASKAHEGNGD